MSEREWEINPYNPVFRTSNGDISVNLRKGDEVDLRCREYEYTASISAANELEVSEGIVKNIRPITSTYETEINIGDTVIFTFDKIFAVRRN